MPSAHRALTVASEVSDGDTLTRGDLTVTIDTLRQVGKAVVVHGSAERAGCVVAIDWPVVIVNPPLGRHTVIGVTHDPREALLDVLEGLA